MSRRSKLVVLLLSMAAVIAIGAGSVAVADWVVTGSGNEVSAAFANYPLGTGGATPTASLYPGGTGSATIHIYNYNFYQVRVTDIVGNGPITSNKGAACDASTGVTFTDQSGLAFDVPARTNKVFTMPSSVSMDHTSDNSCAGAGFTIPVSLTGVPYP